jgi:hypothetical protein
MSQSNSSDTTNPSPSLCIPRVFQNITFRRIKGVFDELRLGEIDRVDLVRCENAKGEKFKRAYIHFNSWYDNEEAQQALEIIRGGGTFEIIYDDPWFWKCSMSRVRKPDQAPDAKKVHRPARKWTSPTIRTSRAVTALQEAVNDQTSAEGGSHV